MRRVTKYIIKAGAAAAAFSAVEPIMRERRYRTEPREPVVWAPGAGEKVLLKNAEVVDVLTGNVRHRRGLLLSAGRIEDMLSERKSASAGADKVIDLDGKYVIPGLINAHCHMLFPLTISYPLDLLAAAKRQAERNFEECITHGVTTVRDAGSPPFLLRRFVDRVEGGDLLGPRVFYAGSFINVPGGYPSDYMPELPPPLAKKWGNAVSMATDPREIRDAVKRNLDLGSSLIKTALDDINLFVSRKQLPVMDDRQLEALVDEAHSGGVKVTAHHRFKRGLKRALKLGVDVLDHCAADEPLDDEDIEAFVSGGHYIIPTAQAAWALSGFSRGDPYLDDPLVQRNLANRLEVVRSRHPAFCEAPVHRLMMRYEDNYRDPGYVEKRHLMYTLETKIFTKAIVVGKDNIIRLYEAGARICCGNDGGMPQTPPGDLGTEMVLLAEIGITPLDVLRSATINNAQLLGREEELGSVDRGKLADLVVLSGNPLERMEHVLDPEAVFKEGKLAYTTHRLNLV